MALSRREFLRTSALGIIAYASPTHGSTFPNRSIRLVCPWPAGGVTDVLARALAQFVAADLGQSVVVDNRAGAGGMIGSAEVARAPADGYTLLFNTSSLVQSQAVAQQKLYDPVKDFTIIGSLGRTIMPFIVPAQSPANTLEEFVNYARGRQLSYATFGAGTTSHAFQQLFSDYNKLNMVHVPYKGEAPMLSDVMGNQVPCAMGTMSTLAPQIKAGTVKALAVLSPDRIEDFPQIPTFVELGYPSEFGWRGGFIGFFGPANLPNDVANVLAGAFNKMLADPVMQRAMKLNFVVGKPTVLQDAAHEVVTTRDAWGDLVARLHLAAN